MALNFYARSGLEVPHAKRRINFIGFHGCLQLVCRWMAVHNSLWDDEGFPALMSEKRGPPNHYGFPGFCHPGLNFFSRANVE